jgi:hypothetical protein
MAHQLKQTKTQYRRRQLAKRATDVLLTFEDRVEAARHVTYMLTAFTADGAKPTEEQLQKLERLLDKVEK